MTADTVLLGSATPNVDLDLVHQRMGHRNKRDLASALGKGRMTGYPPVKNRKPGLCGDYVRAKSTRASIGHAQAEGKTRGKHFEKLTLQPRETVVQQIVTDLKGPMSVEGFRGELYMQLFTSSNTKWREVY